MREIRWNEHGKFERGDGTSFVPFGGVYANFLWCDPAGIEVAPERLSAMSPFGGYRVLEFQDATDAELRAWLRYLKAESMNFVRFFNRGAMSPVQDPLDICGRVNPGLWEKTRRYLDIAAEEGIYFHFVICQEPRCSVYMNERVRAQRASLRYTPEETAALPPHRRRFLAADTPRAGYETFFSDPDILQCHKDYLSELAPLLKDHPALLSIEIYNEQQWGDHFFWHAHDAEVRWSAAQVRHIHDLFPGVPVCCSFAGFGIAAQDPLLWIEQVPMDFFSPHLYQSISGTSNRLDFAGICDAVVKYSQPERPTMIGETDTGHFAGLEVEHLIVRDLAWFSALNNAPGQGLWMSPGCGEFEIPRRVMEEIDFAHFQPKPPAVMVDIREHVAFFQDPEAHPSPVCHLPEDVWCPHRPEDLDHRYCVKMQSRQLQDLYNWEHFALKNGVRYAFTRFPERFERTWKITGIGGEALKSMARPFIPSPGCHLKYLSSADERVHVVYLRNFTYLKVETNSGRMKGRPRPVRVEIDLAGGEYALDIWNLDRREKTTRTCGARAPLDLGVTTDDFALVLRRS